FVVWLSYLVVFSSAPVLALESKSCLEKSEKFDVTKRTEFLETCLDQVNNTENVRALEKKHKADLCEGNARNMKLSGQAKANYIGKCVNKNEAAAALKEDKAGEVAKGESKKASSVKTVKQKQKTETTRKG
ncbi:MAG TPA: hypothetical protein VGD24_01945, partial [Gallionella sp.]